MQNLDQWKFDFRRIFHTCLLIHSNVLCYHGRKLNTVELLKTAR